MEDASPSFARLFAAAAEATSGGYDPIETDSDLAEAMGESRQTIGNWKARGVSKAGAIKAEHIFGCPATFILNGEKTTDKLSPGFTNVTFPDKNHQPGLVFAWDEVIRMFRAGIEAALPDVFSVELTDDALPGRARKGDIVTLCRSKVATIEAGDGVLVRTASDHYMLRIYRPKGDGTFLAEATSAHYQPLHSEDDGLSIIAVVVGVPSCRWASL